MKETDDTLRHPAFFEELATLDDTTSAWNEISAGLVVLRLVDTWIEQGPSTVAHDAWGMSAVDQAIDRVGVGRPVRGILRSIVDAMAACTVVDVHAVTPRLLAYGRALDFDARWTLAADVFATVARHADPVDDSESAIAAHLRLGFCRRQLGDLDRSAEAYRTAAVISASVGDMMGVLRARIGDAKLAILRGNIPQAEVILDETIGKAVHHNLPAVESMALHERSIAAGMRGDYELAIQLAYRALANVRAENDRDRILSDIATAFYLLGVRTAARDAYLVLASTALEQYLRWNASIQLLAIAADDRMNPIFERYRRELAESDLPPTLAVDFQLQVGRGYRLFGDRVAAGLWLGRALSTAREFKFNQELFLVEAEMERLLRDEREEDRVEEDIAPAGVTEVAAALRHMRESVGAGSG